MSLMDPKGSAPGGDVGYQTLNEIWTNGDTGEQSSQGYTSVRWARNRTPNTSSPVRTIPGTTTPWRDPTTFARNVIWHYPSFLSTNYKYPGDRVDTRYTPTSRYVGNSPALHEFLPLFPQGGYDRPVYDYNDYARAVTECLIKIGDGKANLAESLATYKQTVNMIASSASTLFKALLAVKRGNFGELGSIFGLSPKGIGGRLLEWRYGWQPLASDINALMEGLQNMEPKSLMLSARRVVKGTLNISDDSVTPDEWRELSWSTKTEYRTTCHLVGRLSDEWLRRGTQYGLANPLALGWELIPWSFVVDWALPIGNVLQAYTAPAGLTFVGGYTSAVIQGRKDINISAPMGNSNLYGSPGTYNVERFGFRRDALAGWPLPLPYVKSPLSSTHTENALALLLQLMK